MQAVRRLVRAYEALASAVPSERSHTASLIHAGDSSRALERLSVEIRELEAVLSGDHSHPNDKSGLARSLLEQRGLAPSSADLLLEASQVSYWWIVSELAGGRTLDAGALEEALRAGAASRGLAFGKLARSAAASPTAASVYGLLGRVLADRGLPLELFAVLDLAEMATQPYLREALRGA